MIRAQVPSMTRLIIIVLINTLALLAVWQVDCLEASRDISKHKRNTLKQLDGYLKKKRVAREDMESNRRAASDFLASWLARNNRWPRRLFTSYEILLDSETVLADFLAATKLAGEAACESEEEAFRLAALRRLAEMAQSLEANRVASVVAASRLAHAQHCAPLYPAKLEAAYRELGGRGRELIGAVLGQFIESQLASGGPPEARYREAARLLRASNDGGQLTSETLIERTLPKRWQGTRRAAAVRREFHELCRNISRRLYGRLMRLAELDAETTSSREAFAFMDSAEYLRMEACHWLCQSFQPPAAKVLIGANQL